MTLGGENSIIQEENSEDTDDGLSSNNSNARNPVGGNLPRSQKSSFNTLDTQAIAVRNSKLLENDTRKSY